MSTCPRFLHEIRASPHYENPIPIRLIQIPEHRGHISHRTIPINHLHVRTFFHAWVAGDAHSVHVQASECVEQFVLDYARLETVPVPANESEGVRYEPFVQEVIPRDDVEKGLFRETLEPFKAEHEETSNEGFSQMSLFIRQRRAHLSNGVVVSF